MLPGLAELRRPQAAFRPASPHTRSRKRVVCVKNQASPNSKTAWHLLQQTGNAALAAGLALTIGFGCIVDPPPAKADDQFERRVQRRKELLSKTREKALASGATEGEADSSAVPAVSAAEEQQTKDANSEVERSNAEREREATRMRESLKSSIKTYDAASKSGEKKLKPGADNPSWFTNLLEKSSKKDSGSPEGQPAAPTDTNAASALGQFLKPKEEPPSLPPAPAAPAAPREAPKPSFSFSKPSAPEPEKVPESPTQPLPPPPERKPEITQLEPKNSPPAASKPVETPAFSFQSPAPPQSKPAPVTPTPTPQTAAKPAAKPAKKIGVQPVQPIRKEQKQVVAKKGKRSGPLPAWFVQIVLLGAFGGLGYASFQKEEETRRVLAVIARAVSSTYNKVASALDKSKKKAA